MKIYIKISIFVGFFVTIQCAHAWTIWGNFDSGINDSIATGNSSPFTSPFATKFSNSLFFNGSQSAMLDAVKGQEGYGHWGGEVDFPTTLHRSDELWIRLRTFFPNGFDYTAGPRLKFLRVHVKKPDGNGGFVNGGYNDIYINPPGSVSPFWAIKEFQDIATSIGNNSNTIQVDTWETYELYLKLDNVSEDNGGQGIMRFWKNGQLLMEKTNIETLNTADSYADLFYLFSYWNSDPFTKVFIVNNVSGNFQQGEILHGSISQYNFNLQKIRQTNEFEVYDATRKNAPNFVIGETVTGLTSGAIATVSNVQQQYPSKSQNMFVDDVVLTTETPQTVDASGNKMIGLNQLSIQITYSITDYISMLSNWLRLGTVSDINQDGSVNAKDLGIMMSRWQ